MNSQTSTPAPQLWAISLWQPWATLWVLQEKVYETRSWQTPAKVLPRRMLVHAALRWTASGSDFAMEPDVKNALRRHKDTLVRLYEAAPAACRFRIVHVGGNEYVHLPLGAYR